MGGGNIVQARYPLSDGQADAGLRNPFERGTDGYHRRPKQVENVTQSDALRTKQRYRPQQVLSVRKTISPKSFAPNSNEVAAGMPDPP